MPVGALGHADFFPCEGGKERKDANKGGLGGEKERNKTDNPREGWGKRKKENGQPKGGKKERTKTDNPREGWEDGTPPPHRDFKERCVIR